MNNTERLNLQKYDAIQDSKEPFSINKGLNANWDIIDSNLLSRLGDTFIGKLTFKANSSTTEAFSLDITNSLGEQNEKLSSINWENNGTCIGFIRGMVDSNGVRQILLQPVSDDNKPAGSLGIKYDNGNIYTYASSSSALNSIVTTIGISKKNNGYVKFGNGIILQWGNFLSTSTSGTITMPIGFTSKDSYRVTATDTGSARVSNGIVRKSTTQFTYYVATANNGSDWLAIGY